MGAVDLVVQVEAPPTVAAGLQRVGRAGHQVGAVSRGVLFPKYRGDLVQCAVVAERMKAGAIESMRYLRNPLDVLAQQIVAMVSRAAVARSTSSPRLVRRSAPFAALPDSALHAVLDMLAGRYPSDAFAELRPRLTWDRVTDTLTAPRRRAAAGRHQRRHHPRPRPVRRLPRRRRGHRRTAGRRARRGDGLRVARRRRLPARLVLLADRGHHPRPRAGHPRARAAGQDAVLARRRPRPAARAGPGARRVPARGRVGDAARPGSSGPAPPGSTSGARPTCWPTSPSSRRRPATCPTTARCWSSGSATSSATGGWSCTRPSARRSTRRGRWSWRPGCASGTASTSPSMHSDDGIVLRLPDTTGEPPEADLAVLDPDDVEREVTAEVGSSALFASRFRECAARALLLPRRDPRRRTPLWQQRQRAAQLLSVASEFASFPITLEAARECCRTSTTCPGLVELMRDVAGPPGAGGRGGDRRPPRRSPGRCCSATSGSSSTRATRRWPSGGPRRWRSTPALLAELLGRAELRELLDGEAMAEIEAELQRLPAERHPRDVDGAADLLRLLGDLTAAEAAARGRAAGVAGRAGGRPPGAAGAHRRRGAAASPSRTPAGCATRSAPRCRSGVPEVFTEPVADPLGDLVGPLRPHPRAVPAAPRSRPGSGLGVAVVTATLQRLTGTGRLVTGEFRPGGTGQEWCDAEVLRSIRRRQPGQAAPGGRAGPDRHAGPLHRRPGRSVGGRLRGADGVLRRRRAAGRRAGPGQRAGVAGAARPGARLLPRDARRAHQRRRGAVGRRRRRCPAATAGSAWSRPTSAPLLLPEPLEPPRGRRARCSTLLAGGQALFFRGLSDPVGATDDTALADLVWDLVWAGALTNDTLAPLRTLLGGGGTHRRTPAPPGRGDRARYGRTRLGRPPMPTRTGPPTVAGRWSRLPDREPDATRRTHRARRGAARAARRAHPRRGDGRAGGRRLRRGLPGAAGVRGERPRPARLLRRDPGRGPVRHPGVGRPAAQLRRPRPACPAAPSCWPRPTRPTSTAPRCPGPTGRPRPTPTRSTRRGHRPTRKATGHRAGRKAGALVVLVDGELVLYVERGGKTLLSWTEDEHDAQGGGHGAVRRRRAPGRWAAWRCRRPTARRCTSPRRCRRRCRPPASAPPRGACGCAADRSRPAHGSASQSSR